jgi:HAD superfamily hydrolase (TIGR01509 family)
VASTSIRAVVFDLDGLMVDSEPLAKWAWSKVLARHGHRLDDQTYREVLGMRVADCAALLVRRYELGLSAEEALAEREELFLDAVASRLQARPGLAGLLEELQTRGALLGIATSGHRRYVDLALSTVALKNRFQAIAAGDDVERGKPAPDLFLLAAHRLAAGPLECLALEDTPLGVRAASSAGMICIAVPNRWTSGLDFPGAYAVVPTLDEVRHRLDDLLSLSAPPPQVGDGTRYYEAAGGVVVHERSILLLRRPSRGEVRLPKGHIDEGESALQAALRETTEESGYAGLSFRADLGAQVVRFDDQGSYVVRRERYFLLDLLDPEGEPAARPEEEFSPVWMSWEEALSSITFQSEREWIHRGRALWRQ